MKRHIVMDREFPFGFMDDPKLHLEEYLSQHGPTSENVMGMNSTL